MIKLTRPDKPAYLTSEKEAELTEKFRIDGSAVWKNTQITEPLLRSSFSKCAYCECGLQETDSFMEVEHFQHKGKYDDKVVQWSNLLPTCKRCNTKKGTHDVILDPIMDPFVTTPNTHLYLDVAFMRYRDDIGRSTVEVLDLNSADRLAIPRFMITIQLENNLNSIEAALSSYLADRTVRRQNKLIGISKSTLRECQPNTQFSATAATFIHRSSLYSTLRDAMRAAGVWDGELEMLHQVSSSIQLAQ